MQKLALPVAALAIAIFVSGCSSSPQKHQPAASPSQVDPVAVAPTESPSPTRTGPSGLVVVTGVRTGASTVSIDSVDPVLGTTANVAGFRTGSIGQDPVGFDTDAVTDYGPSPIAVSSLFSPDFALMAAAITDSTGHSDLGWLSKDGRFTNVTAPLWKTGDFSTVPTYRNAQFTSTGKYYFTEDLSDGGGGQVGTFMSASVPVPGAPVVVSGAPTDGEWYWMSPDGTVSSLNPGEYFYQENVTPGVGTVRAQSWVDASSWLGVDSNGGQIWLSTNLTSRKAYNVMDWGQGGKALTPAASGYTVWSPVVSPDKTTVAFLARQGTTISIFTVPISGGTPKKVPDGAGLDQTSVIVAWK